MGRLSDLSGLSVTRTPAPVSSPHSYHLDLLPSLSRPLCSEKSADRRQCAPRRSIDGYIAWRWPLEPARLVPTLATRGLVRASRRPDKEWANRAWSVAV